MLHLGKGINDSLFSGMLISVLRVLAFYVSCLRFHTLKTS